MNQELLYRAVLPYYCCGFLAEDGLIIDAAPIMRWAIGKTVTEYTQWAASKGGKVELIDVEP